STPALQGPPQRPAARSDGSSDQAAGKCDRGQALEALSTSSGRGLEPRADIGGCPARSEEVLQQRVELAELNDPMAYRVHERPDCGRGHLYGRGRTASLLDDQAVAPEIGDVAAHGLAFETMSQIARELVHRHELAGQPVGQLFDV